MGIDVAWISEDNETRQEVYDPQQRLSRLATSRWPQLTETRCLKFIDAYGDTVFNQAQILVLLVELNSELSSHIESDARSHLAKVIRLVERAVGKTHTYIKFIGD